MNHALLLVLGVLVNPVPLPGPGGAGPQPALEPVALRFAEAWQAADGQALGGMLRSSGIHMDLRRERHVSIQPRQAQAALREFLHGFSRGEAQVVQAAPAGGDPRKGFADIRWRTQSLGGGVEVTFTVFVAFALEGEGWRVTEVRVLSTTPTPS